MIRWHGVALLIVGVAGDVLRDYLVLLFTAFFAGAKNNIIFLVPACFGLPGVAGRW